ncbi:uncharacterized protein LOC124411501 isoform X2 [Diprion similis]|uniref:uncharacterized protein LOC124411501 isoform X2 n=1 Tax=Diprion similis TaxID=362088 RepID=UPI001EF959B1|nr:uncharacterized protein LOC124411501 isoform X2 [Diprion similis]
MSEESEDMITQGNHNFSNQFTKAIYGLRYVMIYLGVWPGQKYQNWYRFIWFFHSASLIFLATGSVGGLVMLRHDVNKLINNLSMSSPMILIFCKWLTFSSRKKLCEKLMRSMDEDWVKLRKGTLIYKSVPESQRIITNHYQASNAFVYTFLIVATIATINFATDSLLSLNHRGNNTDQYNLLPMPYSWYPVDYNRSVYIIQFLVVAQIISMVATFLATTAIDGFFVTAILHVSSQLKILKHFVKGITYEPSHPEHHKTQIREMVKRHQVLLNVAATLQDCYSLIALQHVMACMFALCFLEYSFLMELQENGPSKTVLLKFGLFVIGSLETAFIYCFAGDSLTNQIVKVAASYLSTLRAYSMADA